MSATITKHHVVVLRGRMQLSGLSVADVARITGVSTTTVHAILAGHQAQSRHLGRILGAVGLDPDMSGELVAMHAQLIDAVRAAGRADFHTLRAALAVLEQTSQKRKR